MVKSTLADDHGHLNDCRVTSGHGSWRLISVKGSLLFLPKFIDVTATVGPGQARIRWFKPFLHGWVCFSIKEI